MKRGHFASGSTNESEDTEEIVNVLGKHTSKLTLLDMENSDLLPWKKRYHKPPQSTLPSPKLGIDNFTDKSYQIFQGQMVLKLYKSCHNVEMRW